MGSPKEYILPNTGIGTLSVYDLLKHTQNASFMDKNDFGSIYPISLELNAGVFTKIDSLIGFPKVALSQSGNSLISACSCGDSTPKLCEHQAEVIYCVLEQRDFRIFFDNQLRNNIFLQSAKGYGLESEPNLDAYFQLSYANNTLQIDPKVKEILPFDELVLKNSLLPQRDSIIKSHTAQTTTRRRILVISRHRYYNQVNFLLMEADRTKSGKIKNPITNTAPMQLIWGAADPLEIKFYTALFTFQNKYNEDNIDTDLEALRSVVRNPLALEVYQHDRDISDTISVKSLLPVGLSPLKAEIQLTVFKKEPFFEITGELMFNDIRLPFSHVVIKNGYFVYHRQTFHLMEHPDMIRVIRFFKENNEVLLVHSSKYEAFVQSILAPLEQFVHINYSYIHRGTPAQLEEIAYKVEPIIYLHQEGNFIAITPIIKYGTIEIAVYSRKQVIDTDQNGNEFKVNRDTDAELRLTSIIMKQHADFEEQLRGHEYFYLHRDRFFDDTWFLDAFDIWRNEGITILGFDEIKHNNRNPHSAKISVEVNSGIDWFNAKLTVQFGQQKATLRQVHRAIRNKSKFVRLDDGTEGILPDEWMEKISRYFQVGEIYQDMLTLPKINFTEITDLFDKEVLSTEVQQEIEIYKQEFTKISTMPDIEVSPDLQTELRDYQREGLKWLDFLDRFSFGGCLADDMGLGKTVQIIAFILSQRQKYGHTTNLIVVPTSLLFNWQEEITKFAPSISILLHYGADRDKSISGMHAYEVVLTSYGMLLSDVGFLKTFRFNYIFLDESQAIKNPSSERHKSARLLQSRNKIVLTGTPIENNTFDLYGQLSFACPGLLGSKQYFRDTYVLPIDKFEYSKRAQELQQKIKPFILRRTKKQVATELPEKTEMVIYCEMNSAQRSIYDAYELELREFISATDQEEIRRNGMHVLTGLTRLRQICNSPALLKEGHSGDSAVKIEVLMEQIENKSKDHKILVFSQFVGMLDLIKAGLIARNIPFEYLTGQTKNRGTNVKNFQYNDSVRVFLISLKTGGVGLNLTEADYVYLVDPWWNPASENQAIDRTYRIGQNKNVVAVRLICRDTVEEKIMHMQKKKSRLAQDLITTDSTFFNSLSKNELLDIL